MVIRAAAPADDDVIWEILQPTIGAGETLPLPRGMARNEVLAYWFMPGHEVLVAEDGGRVVGTYYLRANQPGAGSHVANCGYATAPRSMGRGVGRAMCQHSLIRARERGFLAMQFNFVISTNERAVRLWQFSGFEIVGRLPSAFNHPKRGFVDVLVMFRRLDAAIEKA
jgi:ribosomal protein S18 acetylase RimI-like enzyme